MSMDEVVTIHVKGGLYTCLLWVEGLSNELRDPVLVIEE